METIQSKLNINIYRGNRNKTEKKKRSRSAENFKNLRKGRRNKEEKSN